MCLIFSAVVVGIAAPSALMSSAAVKWSYHAVKLLGPGCVLDTDAMCRRNEIIMWLVCRIGGNGSDWKLGLHSTHRSRGGPRMHVLLGRRKRVLWFLAGQVVSC